jgi:hypothetical protein
MAPSHFSFRLQPEGGRVNSKMKALSLFVAAAVDQGPPRGIRSNDKGGGAFDSQGDP